MEEQLDPNNLDNLRESINISRQLIDNAKALYNINKDGANEMYKGFRDAAKMLSKSLQDTNLNWEKYIGYSADYKKILEKITSIEKHRDSLMNERLVLDKLIQQKLKEQIDLTKVEEVLYARMVKASTITYKNKKEEWELTNKKGLNLSKEITSIAQSINASKSLEESTNRQLITLSKHSEILEKIQGKVSLVKRIYESIAKVPILGGFVDAEAGIARFQRAQVLNRGFWASLGSSMKAAFSSLAKASIILLALEAAIKLFNFFKDAMFGADKLITDISRKMAITKSEAAKVRDEFIGITYQAENLATVQSGVLLSTKEVYETWNDINEQLGTAVKLDTTFLAQMTILKSKIGLSSEALKGLTFFSRAGEKSSEGIVQNIIRQNILLRIQGKSSIENFKLIESTLKINGQLRALYKGNTDEIAKGVTQAHAMGTTLEQINNIAKGFLDFESSISAEMEAQLLTGKNINLDQARYLSLIGDTTGMMKEIGKNFPKWNEFNTMNRIAQEGYAKALGISVDQMSDMVFEQETLNKLSKANSINLAGQNGAKAQAELMSVKSSKDIMQVLNKYNISLEERVKLLGEEQYRQLQNQSAQDKFGMALEKAKEAFANLVNGGTLNKLADIVTALANSLSRGIGGIFHMGEELRKTQLEQLNTLALTDKTVAKQVKNMTYTRDVAGTMGFQKEQYISPDAISKILYNSKKEDFVMRGNTVTPFRKDDIIMGGTNIGGGTEELKMLNKNIEILIEITKQGKNINLDSYPIGTILSLGSLKTQ